MERKTLNFQLISPLRKMEMENKKYKNKGLTLIELIIVVAILGIIIPFMFTFFRFNYSTFFRSKSNYYVQTNLNEVLRTIGSKSNYYVQTNLNEVLRTIDEELRFADQITIYEKYDEYKFDNNKNYIYLKDNIIKLKKANGEIKNLTSNDIKISELFFYINNNLITINIEDIEGENMSKDEEFNIEYTIELLNFIGKNNSEGTVIEYYQTKGDDTH